MYRVLQLVAARCLVLSSLQPYADHTPLRGLHHRLVYKLLTINSSCSRSTHFRATRCYLLIAFSESAFTTYTFIFQLHKLVYLSLYILVNIWTISIHDGDFLCSPVKTFCWFVRFITYRPPLYLTRIMDVISPCGIELRLFQKSSSLRD